MPEKEENILEMDGLFECCRKTFEESQKYYHIRCKTCNALMARVFGKTKRVWRFDPSCNDGRWGSKGYPKSRRQ